MSKQAWEQHIRETENHKWDECPRCQERAKTLHRNAARKMKADICRSLGLMRVVGCVSGREYWE